LSTTRDRLLKLGDRKSSLDAACLVSWIDGRARVVHVRIEKPGNDSPAAEVDGLRIRTKRHRLPDIRDAAVPDGERGRDDSSAVHELSVHKNKIAFAPAPGRTRRGRLGRRCQDFAAAYDRPQPALDPLAPRQHGVALGQICHAKLLMDPDC
jgi:hypothetical protein